MVAGGRSSGEGTVGGSGGFFSSSGELEARGLGRGGRGGDGGPNWGGEAAGGWPDGGSWRLGFQPRERELGELGEKKKKKKEKGFGLGLLPTRSNKYTQQQYPTSKLPIFTTSKLYQ